MSVVLNSYQPTMSPVFNSYQLYMSPVLNSYQPTMSPVFNSYQLYSLYVPCLKLLSPLYFPCLKLCNLLNSYNTYAIRTFAGIDIDTADNKGVTPLISTAQFGQPLTMAWLLHKGASPHVSTVRTPWLVKGGEWFSLIYL